MSIDLNCDMGEGMPHDEALMPFITSANIACGFHAGSGALISHTIDLAVKHGVKIGAHPSFHDREHFGRKEMNLRPEKLYAILLQQLVKIDLIAKEKGTRLHHVKPHGALYNMSARDAAIAHTIANAVKDFDESLVLFGLSGSQSIEAAQKMGLQTMSEVFADRTYQDDGSLTPRIQSGALIESEEQSRAQVLQMVRQGTVTTITGNTIPIQADTICLHGDGAHALTFAQLIHTTLQQLPLVS
ncbi:MAG TPA: 5-oxoprolinase subunit PxpA [Flavisolibacter sp.]|nr:5-oxoprolinase subunit PxpA [Flavisolibacter sp.]